MSSMKIKFVTDSVADIPADIAVQRDITVVPCFVNYEGGSYADDGVELDRDKFYRRLPDMNDLPTTSAMSPDFAREGLDAAFDDADHVFIITTPARLSGIYNAFRLAAESYPAEQYTLIDSGQLSLGIADQVLVGTEVAAETGSVETTLRAIRAVQQNQAVYAAIDDLKHLRRSGRVGWATASLGALLQIKPVVQVQDGEVSPLVRVRTTARMIDKMVELARQHAPLDRLGILHVNNPEGLEALKTQLADIAPPDTIIGTMSPALGTHVGPGALGLAAVRKGWKDAITTGNTG